MNKNWSEVISGQAGFRIGSCGCHRAAPTDLPWSVEFQDSPELVRSCRGTLSGRCTSSRAAAKCQIVLAQGWARCWLSCFYSLCLFLFESKLLPRLFMTCLRQLAWQPPEWLGGCYPGRKAREGKLLLTSTRASEKGSCQALAQHRVCTNSFHPPQNSPKREVLLLTFCSREN